MKKLQPTILKFLVLNPMSGTEFPETGCHQTVVPTARLGWPVWNTQLTTPTNNFTADKNRQIRHPSTTGLGHKQWSDVFHYRINVSLKHTKTHPIIICKWRSFFHISGVFVVRQPANKSEWPPTYFVLKGKGTFCVAGNNMPMAVDHVVSEGFKYFHKKSKEFVLSHFLWAFTSSLTLF